jgi:hypothetical protein
MRLCRRNSDRQTTDFLLAPLPDLGQMRPCASQVIRSLTWALKQVDPVNVKLLRCNNEKVTLSQRFDNVIWLVGSAV